MIAKGKRHIFIGSLLAILTSLCVALMGVFTKKIDGELPVSMMLFFRFSINLLAAIPLIMMSKEVKLHKIPHPLHLSVRILSALLSIFFLFYSLRYIPLTSALLLNNTSVLFIPIFAYVIAGAKTPAKAIIGIITGFIGVIWVLHPSSKIMSMGSVFALLSGIFASIAYVEMRILSNKKQAIHMMFYYYFVSFIISAIYAAVQWKAPVHHIMWLYLVLVGVFGTLYQFFITWTFKTAPVRLMTPVLFTTVIFGGILDWLIWGVVPTQTTYIGAVLIVVGAIVTLWFGSKSIVPAK